MSMTTLEKVLAEALAKVANVDIPAIIAAAQAACVGGCKTEACAPVEVVVSAGSAIGQGGTATQEPEKPKRTRTAPVKEGEPVKPVDQPPPAQEPPAASVPPVVEKQPPVIPAPTVGIDLSGLFTGSGADKKVVKDVFLKAVDSAKTLAALVALNATCDCGFAVGDYTEETAPVLKRKLTRWGAAQE